MPATSANRETYRDYLATIYTTKAVGAGKPAAALYGYLPADFDGQTPVITITSAAVMRNQEILGGKWQPDFFVRVTHYVLYASTADGWTEANAEDRLDLMEKTLADLIMDNRGRESGAPWDLIDYMERSETSYLIIGGLMYKTETFLLGMEVTNG